LDRFQREHRVVGFPLAVIYKVFDDRAPHLAAMVTYYAFVALFPLMLLLTSITGFFLDQSPHLRQDLVNSALKNIPGIGNQLERNLSGFHGSTLGLIVGLLGTLYGALGATQAAQAAFNQIYGVPRNDQPNPLRSRVRSLGLLLLVGAAVVVSTGLAALVSTANGLSAQIGAGLDVAGYSLSLAINIALFAVAFRLLTARELDLRHVITGGILAGVLWEALQTFGSLYVAHEARHGSAFYGVFGVVLATIAWIYLEALVLMVSAEVNVVLNEGLWPRSLLTPFTDQVELTPADEKAYAMYAAAQRFKGFQRIATEYHPHPTAPDPDIKSGGRRDS
jgi:YihY family inner membrane protein